MSGKGNKKKSTKKRQRPAAASTQPGRQKQSNVSNRPTEYRKLDSLSLSIREPLLQQCANKVMAHLTDRKAAGYSSCKQGFVKNMVEGINKKLTPEMAIKVDDVNNLVKKLKKAAEKEEAAAAKKTPPPPPPTWVIQGGLGSSATSSTSVHPPSQPENTSLTVLADAASARAGGNVTTSSQMNPLPLTLTPLQPPAASASSSSSTASNEGAVTAPASTSESTVAGATSSVATSSVATSHGQTLAHNVPSTLTQLPNRCDDPECGAPVSVVPESCSHCGLGKVHLLCQMFRLNRFCSTGEMIKTPGELICYKCPAHSSSTNVATSSNTQAASATDVWMRPPSLSASTRSPTTATSASALASSSTESQPRSVPIRKKGGRPEGSTNANKLNQTFNRKRAVNYVCEKYRQAKRTVSRASRSSKKKGRVAKGTRNTLVEQAKERFGIKDDKFDVPKQTIESRIQSERLEVWHPGNASPVGITEVVVKMYIITAANVNAALSVSSIIALANNLLEGTPQEKVLRDWKKSHVYYNEDAPLLGRKWFAQFMKRNPDLESQYGKKFARNRDAHTHDTAFTKMGKQIEAQLIDSGNAERFDVPIHMDKVGNAVDNEKDGFGRPVTIAYTDPSNVFVIDETGDNTTGKNDGNNAGEKKVGPKGQIPKETVGIKDSHFTVLPVHDLTGKFRLVAVIFASEKLNPSWALGVDIFAEIDEEDFANNFGPGKRFPGLDILDDEGNEVPVVFAATPNASMTSAVLMQIFKKMDEKGISTRVYDSDGKLVKYPVLILDGHVSRMGEAFLVYINGVGTKWGCVLGAPYGTHIWQVHDDSRLNGIFKCMLALAKSEFFMKKRRYGLDPEILPQEIVVVLKTALEKSFSVRKYAVSGVAHRGWFPFNRNYLDHPDILSTASDDVQKERLAVFECRGQSSDVIGRGLATEWNLLESGSGFFAGGAAVTQQLAETIQSLNHNNATTSNIFSLVQNHAALNNGRQDGATAEGPQLTSEELAQRYKDSRRLSAGEVFGNGDGRLGEEIRDAVVARNRAAAEREATKLSNNKTKLRDRWKNVKKIRREMKKKQFKWTNAKLTVMCQWKKNESDKKMPTKKDELLKRYDEVMNRPSPNVSLHESDSDRGLSSDESLSGSESEGKVMEEELAASEDESEDEIPLEDDVEQEEGLVFSDSDDDDDDDELSDDGSGDESLMSEDE